MKIGIVGLPNVGKSTLFKALTKKQVEASNYPFCTIDPNVGIVEVPDERLNKLAQVYNSVKIVPAIIEFVDIAGLVKNAHKGEGLGNQFLSHIREVDAIAHVIRNFHNENITHVHGAIDPLADMETITTELAMADLAVIEKYINRLKDKIKSGDKEALKTSQILDNIRHDLDQNKKPNILNLNPEEFKLIKNINLLSLKPELFIENIDEAELGNKNHKTLIIKNKPALSICAQLESEIAELDDFEAKKYLKELSIEKTGLNRLITESYQLLNLITFFTSGPKETHAWTIKAGSKAPAAAGKIHTDFEQGFIRAEIINWQDLIDSNGDVKAKEKGLMRIEGKDYVVQDGDVAHFRFSP